MIPARSVVSRNGEEDAFKDTDQRVWKMQMMEGVRVTCLAGPVRGAQVEAQDAEEEHYVVRNRTAEVARFPSPAFPAVAGRHH